MSKLDELKRADPELAEQLNAAIMGALCRSIAATVLRLQREAVEEARATLDELAPDVEDAPASTVVDNPRVDAPLPNGALADEHPDCDWAERAGLECRSEHATHG